MSMRGLHMLLMMSKIPDNTRPVFVFNGVNQYGMLDSPVQLNGDFEIEFMADLSDLPVNSGLMSGPRGLGGLGAYYRLSSGRLLTITYQTNNGSDAFNVLGGLGDSGVTKCVIKRQGNTLIGIANDKTASETNENMSLTQTLSDFGKLASLYHTGALYDIKVWENGDRDSGNLIGWSVNIAGNAVQPSSPQGNNLTIVNHNPNDWGKIIV